MHSFLITGGTYETRSQWIVAKLIEWKVGKFDVTELAPEETSIGIAQVREFQSKLLLKPTASPFSVGIIRHAETSTVEAQNALLKTLEEPPPHGRVMLESSTPDVFLPTVLSRCTLINLGSTAQYTDEELSQCFKTMEQIVAAPVGKRLQKIDTLAKNREEAAAWIDLAIAAAHQQLSSHPVTQLLRSLLKARQRLAANVNYKLVLDNVFL